MRNTVQRQIVLHAVQKLHIHPTVEDVYQEIQKEHPTISKSTVYRNLHQLAENNEIRLVLLPNSPERFDARLPHHYHFKCKVCGDVIDVDMDYLCAINETVRTSYGFQVEDHDVIFKGLCPKCIGKGGG